MSVECKNRLEVQTILRANILEGLRQLHKDEDGWGVMEFANASFQKHDRIILMNLIRAERVGWQSQRYGGADEFHRTDEWIEQQSWQLHVILKRTNDTEDTAFLAEDMCQQLIAWFNGPGCDFFRRHGMANLVIDTENILVYNDNSDLYQKRCVFTVKIQVPKELTFGCDELEAVKPDIMPV